MLRKEQRLLVLEIRHYRSDDDDDDLNMAWLSCYKKLMSTMVPFYFFRGIDRNVVYEGSSFISKLFL